MVRLNIKNKKTYLSNDWVSYSLRCYRGALWPYPPNELKCPLNHRPGFGTEILVITTHHYALTFSAFTEKCKNLFLIDKHIFFGA